MAIYSVATKLVVQGVDTSSVTRAVNTINSQMDKGTARAKSFADAVALRGINLAGYTVIGAAMVRVTEAISRATSDAIRFEYELAKIAQTVNKTNAEIGTHAESIRNISVAYGLSAPKIAETVRVLAQAGYSFREAKASADSLAQTTLLASFESIADTTDGLIAINKQFIETMGKSAEVLAVLNTVSKKYAVESSDLVEAVRKAGGTFAATGGKMEELVAIFTTVRDTTRESSETIATGLRTIFSRLQRPKTIDYLRELGIELTDLKGNFIGNYEAIQRIQQGLANQKIKKGSIKFAEVVEEVGGIRQQSRVIPLLTQASKLQRIYADTQSAAADTALDLAKAQDTLSFKLAQTQQNFAKLIGDIAGTDNFKQMTTVFIDLANASITFASSLKELIPLISALLAFKIGASFSKILSKNPASALLGNSVKGFARGGFVPGTGSGDTVPAMLEPGEFVIRKSAAQAFGAENLSHINKHGRGAQIKASKLSRSDKNDILRRSGIKGAEKFVSKEYSPKDLKNEPAYKYEQYVPFAQPNLAGETIKYGDINKLGLEKPVAAGLKGSMYEAYMRREYSAQVSSKNDSDDANFPDIPPSKADKLLKSAHAERKAAILKGVELKYRLTAGTTASYRKGLQRKFKTDGEAAYVPMVYAEGKRFASGGAVGTDTVPALLTPGEFVVNKESARAVGYSNLHKINKYATGGRVGAQRFAGGGPVGGFGGLDTLLLGLDTLGPSLTQLASSFAALSIKNAFAVHIGDSLNKVITANIKSMDAEKETRAANVAALVDQEVVVTAAYDSVVDFRKALKDAEKALDLAATGFISPTDQVGSSAKAAINAGVEASKADSLKPSTPIEQLSSYQALISELGILKAKYASNGDALTAMTTIQNSVGGSLNGQLAALQQFDKSMDAVNGGYEELAEQAKRNLVSARAIEEAERQKRDSLKAQTGGLLQKAGKAGLGFLKDNSSQIATAAISIFSSTLKAGSETAEKNTKLAIENGNAQEAYKQSLIATTKAQQSSALENGASAGLAIGTAIAPFLGPFAALGPIVGQVGGALIGYSGIVGLASDALGLSTYAIDAENTARLALVDALVAATTNIVEKSINKSNASRKFDPDRANQLLAEGIDDFVQKVRSENAINFTDADSSRQTDNSRRLFDIAASAFQALSEKAENAGKSFEEIEALSSGLGAGLETLARSTPELLNEFNSLRENINNVSDAHQSELTIKRDAIRLQTEQNKIIEVLNGQFKTLDATIGNQSSTIAQLTFATGGGSSIGESADISDLSTRNRQAKDPNGFLRFDRALSKVADISPVLKVQTDEYAKFVNTFDASFTALISERQVSTGTDKDDVDKRIRAKLIAGGLGDRRSDAIQRAIDEDKDSTASDLNAKLLEDHIRPIGTVLEEFNKVLDKSLSEQIKINNLIESASAKRLNVTLDNIRGEAEVNRKIRDLIAGQFDLDLVNNTNLDAARTTRLTSTQTALAGTSLANNNIVGDAADADLIGKAIERNRTKAAGIQKDLSEGVGNRESLIKEQHDLETEATRLNRAFSALTDTAEEQAIIQAQVTKSIEFRGRVKDVATSSVFGTPEDRRKLSKTLNQAAFVARTGSAQGIRPQDRGAVLELLRNFKNDRLPGLGGKTGNEVINTAVRNDLLRSGASEEQVNFFLAGLVPTEEAMLAELQGSATLDRIRNDKLSSIENRIVELIVASQIATQGKIKADAARDLEAARALVGPATIKADQSRSAITDIGIANAEAQAIKRDKEGNLRNKETELKAAQDEYNSVKDPSYLSLENIIKSLSEDPNSLYNRSSHTDDRFESVSQELDRRKQEQFTLKSKLDTAGSIYNQSNIENNTAALNANTIAIELGNAIKKADNDEADLRMITINAGLPPRAFARGGSAIGTDTVPAMLTPGEFVIRKSAVDHYGSDLMHSINTQRFAEGGQVKDKKKKFGLLDFDPSLDVSSARSNSNAYDSRGVYEGDKLTAGAAATSGRQAQNARDVAGFRGGRFGSGALGANSAYNTSGGLNFFERKKLAEGNALRATADAAEQDKLAKEYSGSETIIFKDGRYKRTTKLGYLRDAIAKTTDDNMQKSLKEDISEILKEQAIRSDESADLSQRRGEEVYGGKSSDQNRTFKTKEATLQRAVRQGIMTQKQADSKLASANMLQKRKFKFYNAEKKLARTERNNEAYIGSGPNAHLEANNLDEYGKSYDPDGFKGNIYGYAGDVGRLDRRAAIGREIYGGVSASQFGVLGRQSTTSQRAVRSKRFTQKQVDEQNDERLLLAKKKFAFAIEKSRKDLNERADVGGGFFSVPAEQLPEIPYDEDLAKFEKAQNAYHTAIGIGILERTGDPALKELQELEAQTDKLKKVGKWNNTTNRPVDPSPQATALASSSPTVLASSSPTVLASSSPTVLASSSPTVLASSSPAAVATLPKQKVVPGGIAAASPPEAAAADPFGLRALENKEIIRAYENSFLPPEQQRKIANSRGKTSFNAGYDNPTGVTDPEAYLERLNKGPQKIKTKTRFDNFGSIAKAEQAERDAFTARGQEAAQKRLKKIAKDSRSRVLSETTDDGNEAFAYKNSKGIYILTNRLGMLQAMLTDKAIIEEDDSRKYEEGKKIPIEGDTKVESEEVKNLIKFKINAEKKKGLEARIRQDADRKARGNQIYGGRSARQHAQLQDRRSTYSRAVFQGKLSQVEADRRLKQFTDQSAAKFKLSTQLADKQNTANSEKLEAERKALFASDKEAPDVLFKKVLAAEAAANNPVSPATLPQGLLTDSKIAVFAGKNLFNSLIGKAKDATGTFPGKTTGAVVSSALGPFVGNLASAAIDFTGNNSALNLKNKQKEIDNFDASLASQLHDIADRGTSQKDRSIVPKTTQDPFKGLSNSRDPQLKINYDSDPKIIASQIGASKKEAGRAATNEFRGGRYGRSGALAEGSDYNKSGGKNVFDRKIEADRAAITAAADEKSQKERAKLAANSKANALDLTYRDAAGFSYLGPDGRYVLTNREGMLQHLKKNASDLSADEKISVAKSLFDRQKAGIDAREAQNIREAERGNLVYGGKSQRQNRSIENSRRTSNRAVRAGIITQKQADAKALAKEEEAKKKFAFRISLAPEQIKKSRAALGDAPKAFASGGHVGTGTDTVPAMLTPGEFVIKKSAVNQYGAGLLNDINTQKFVAGGKVGYYAEGGSVDMPAEADPNDRLTKMRLNKKAMDEELKNQREFLKGTQKNIDDAKKQLAGGGFFGNVFGTNAAVKKDIANSENLLSAQTKRANSQQKAVDREQGKISDFEAADKEEKDLTALQKKYSPDYKGGLNEEQKARIEHKRNAAYNSSEAGPPFQAMETARQGAKDAYQRSQDSYQQETSGVNQMLTKTESSLGTFEDGLRTTQKALILAGATVATGGAAGLAGGALTAGGAAAGIGGATAYGAAVGGTSAFVEAGGHIAAGNKNKEQAYADARKQTADITADSLSTGATTIGGGAIIGKLASPLQRLFGASRAGTLGAGVAGEAIAGAGKGAIDASVQTSKNALSGGDTTLTGTLKNYFDSIITGALSGGTGKTVNAGASRIAKGAGFSDKVAAGSAAFIGDMAGNNAGTAAGLAYSGVAALSKNRPDPGDRGVWSTGGLPARDAEAVPDKREAARREYMMTSLKQPRNRKDKFDFDQIQSYQQSSTQDKPANKQFARSEAVSSGSTDMLGLELFNQQFASSVQQLIEMPKVFEISLASQGIAVNLNGAEFLSKLPELMKSTILDRIREEIGNITEQVKKNLSSGK